MSSTKPQLRESLKQARLALSPEDRQAKSRIISASLLDLADWSGVRALHCFEPIERLGEVDVSGFLDEVRKNHPAVDIYASRKIGGEWRIVQLGSGATDTDTPRFDAVIVPMLGFDSETLHRIGYGGGYYDKFLASQPQASKFGVCFEQGRLERLPAEPHDVPLDTIITEEKTYSSASAA